MQIFISKSHFRVSEKIYAYFSIQRFRAVSNWNIIWGLLRSFAKFEGKITSWILRFAKDREIDLSHRQHAANSVDDSVTMLFELEMILSSPRHVPGGNGIARSRKRRCNIPTSLRPEVLNSRGWETLDIRRGLSEAKRCARNQGVLKGISAGTDGYAACQRPLNFKRVRLPRWREMKEEREREREREQRSRSRKCSPQPSEKNRPAANFDLFPSCWHPSIFYRTFNSILSLAHKRIRKMRRRLRAKKRRFRAAMLARCSYIVRNGSITS